MTDLLQFINEKGLREYNFDKLYEKLIEEYKIEFTRYSDVKKNIYLNNLRITRDKQANNYIRTKQRNSKGDCYMEFINFVRHFKQDVIQGLHMT